MRKWILLLVLVVVLSGCVETYEYKDNALKMEIQSPEESLPSQVVKVVIYLTSQVEKEINDVYLEITNTYSLRVTDVDCKPGNRVLIREKIGGRIMNEYPIGCNFEQILPLDEMMIIFYLETPSKQEIGDTNKELKPEFTLSYEYSGETVLMVPIVKEGEKTKATTNSFQSTGPVKVNIDKGRGVGSEEEQWEREGSVFSIKVELEDVAGSDYEVVVDKDDFTMTLSNLEVYTDGTCDFDETSLHPKENITEDDELICALKARENFEEPWIPGSVVIDFSYHYELVETANVEVIGEIS